MPEAQEKSNTFERTTPYLRPNQVTDMREEEARLKSVLEAPPHIATAVQDRGEIARQLGRLSKQLQDHVPKPYGGDEIDRAKTRERQLSEDIQAGMPTHAEMRRSPAGSVDKHRMWEHRNKNKILEWKNIRLRLLAGGHIDGVPSDATDIANVETLRPVGGSQELPMDNTVITPTEYHLPPPGAGPSVVFTDNDVATVRMFAPEIADKLALLSNDDRRSIKDLTERYVHASDPVEQPAQDDVKPAEPKAKKSTK